MTLRRDMTDDKTICRGSNTTIVFVLCLHVNEDDRQLTQSGHDMTDDKTICSRETRETRGLSLCFV